MRLRPPRAAAPDAAPPPTLRRPPRRSRRAPPTLPDTPAAVDVSDWLASRVGVAGGGKGAHADTPDPLSTTLAKRRPDASSLVVDLARDVTQAAVGGGGGTRFPPPLSDRVAALSPRDASRLLADILSLPSSTGGGVDVALATYAILDGAGGVDAFACAKMVGEVAKHDSVAWPFDDDEGTRSDAAFTSNSLPFPRRRPGPAAALGLYDRWTGLRGGTPDVVAVNAALGAAGRAGEWGRAEALFEYAREHLEVRRGREGRERWSCLFWFSRPSLNPPTLPPQPDAYTYTAYMSAASRCGRPAADALAALDAAVAAGAATSAAVFTAAVSAAARARDVQAALSAFRSMEAAGIAPDVVAYNALLASLVGAAAWEAAWAVVASMRSAGTLPNARSYNALLSACERAGQPDRALEVLGRMRRSGGSGSDGSASGGHAPPTAISYNITLSALAKAGDVSRLRQVVADMQADGFAPDAFTLATVAGGLEKGGTPGSARAAFDDLVSKGATPNTVAYNALLSAQAAARDGGGALATLRAMRAAAAAGRARTAPDARSVSHAVRALVRCGRRADAMALFRSVTDRGESLTRSAAAALLAACESDAAWADGVAVWKAATARGPPPSRTSSAALLAAGRKLVYSFPGLLSALPSSLVAAARAAVEGGAAARALLEQSGIGGEKAATNPTSSRRE